MLAVKERGFLLKQEGYVRDVLDKYQVQGVETHPVPRFEGEEDEEEKMKKASNKHKHCAGNFFGWQVEQDQTCLMEQV